MSLLDTVVYNKLEDGVHEAVLKDYKEVTNEQGGYIALELILDGERPYTYVVFPSQINIVFQSLKGQSTVTKDSNISVKDLLKFLITNTFKFKIWFEYNYEYNRFNLYFNGLQPVYREAAKPSAAVNEGFDL